VFGEEFWVSLCRHDLDVCSQSLLWQMSEDCEIESA
jgi:hypothetical protein